MTLYATPKRMAKTYFDLLDGFVCMYHIAPFLDHASRMNFNATLPIEYRYTKKMNSDAHNFAVKVNLVSRKLNRATKAPPASDLKVRRIKEVMTYMLNTKDDAILSFNPELRAVILEKSQYYSNIHNFPLYYLNNKRALDLMRVCQRLVEKIERVKPRDKIITKKIEIM